MIEQQELHCHACGQYVQFPIDMELNGNHVLECPNCGHEHCRVVSDGKITGDRWDQRNPVRHSVPTRNISYSTASTWTTTASSSGNDSFLYQSWTTAAAGTSTGAW